MDNNKNGRGIFYGVIGVATLVVAIIGATFAYFTASQQSNTGDITGNAASVSFGLRVEREETTDQTNGGLIPMSNLMVQQAVSVGGQPGVENGANKVPCVDEKGNSVCQIYKVVLTNTSSSDLLLDGYITLTGGLADATASTDVSTAPTTMRWAQVFRSGSEGNYTYSTGGNTDIGASSELSMSPLSISGNDPHSLSNIYVDDGQTSGTLAASSINNTASIGGNSLPVIGRNYIRISSTGNTSSRVYTHADLTDALVFNQNVAPTGDPSGDDVKELFFVVWLHENGLVQNAAEGSAENFFGGTVTFQYGSGGQVSATFTGIAKATS